MSRKATTTAKKTNDVAGDPNYPWRYPIPSGWKTSRLGDVMDIVRGISFPKEAKSLEPRDGHVACLRTANVQRDVEWDDLWFVPEQHIKREGQYVCPGDILISTANSYDLVGKVAPVTTMPHRATLGAFISLLRPREELDAKFAYYQISWSDTQDRIRSTASTTTNISNVSTKKLSNIELAFPTRDQQQRIVTEIEKQFSRLDEALTNLKRVKANLKRYKAAVLKAAVEGKLTEEWRQAHPDVEPAKALIARVEQPARPNRYKTRSKDLILGHPALAVGNPGTQLPAGWAWVPLVDIARMESGHTPSRRHPEWWDGDVSWIGIADAREHDDKTILNTQQHTNADGLANSAARLLPAGTVCVSRTASVGYVVVMGKAMATSQDFVNWIPTEAVSSDWLRIIFSADREALRRFGKGSVHKTIYFPEWLSVHIALPPLAEQSQIVANVERRVSSIHQFNSALAANSLRAKKLRQAILGNAFTGTIRLERDCETIADDVA